MRKAFPGVEGFSVSNLEKMKKFALEYPDLTNPAQAVRELPWGHIVTLIHKVKDKAQRNWYAQQTINSQLQSILSLVNINNY